jgi:peroxiredoxin
MKPLLRTLALMLIAFFAIAEAQQSHLKVGDRAPDFALPNGDGKLVTLSEYTSRGPVVVIFYRGFWCGACTVQLTKLAEDYEKIKQAGAVELITISADDQNYAWSMAQTTSAKFQILSDAERTVIKQYGILNAREHDGIAHPSVFIIDKVGRIQYLYVGKDPQDRPADDILLEVIRKIAAKSA